MRQLFASVLVAVALHGCAREETPPGLIVQAGSYASPDGTLELRVSVKRAWVKWEVVEVRMSTSVARYERGFSDSLRWFFHWDERSRLWSYNADVGSFAVLRRDSNALLVNEQVDQSSPLVREIPSAVRPYLPQTLLQTLKAP